MLEIEGMLDRTTTTNCIKTSKMANIALYLWICQAIIPGISNYPHISFLLKTTHY